MRLEVLRTIQCPGLIPYKPRHLKNLKEKWQKFLMQSVAARAQ